MKDEREYSLEDQHLFRHIDHKHPINGMKQREIGIICRTLWQCMKFKGKIRFIWDGNYRASMLETYNVLLPKKDFPPEEPKREIELYYGSETRLNMITLCSNIFSEMKLFHRILYVIAGMYYYPLRKTHKTMINKEQKRQAKILAKMNKKIAKKQKKKS